MEKVSPAMWSHVLKTLLLVWLSASSGVLGYSRGAPDTTCESLTPGHGISRQDSPSPFIITPGTGTIEGGKRMLVTLKAPDNDPGFKGFLVQARNANTQEVVGTFFTTDHSYLTCGKGFNNAVTHSSPTRKPKVILEWEAPSNFAGEVIFSGTFVRVYDTYWVGVTSEKVIVKRGTGSATAPANIPSIITTTTARTAASTVSPSSPASGVGVNLPENVGDSVINVVDAPGVSDVPVVGNGIGVISNDDGFSTPAPTFGFFPSSTSSPSVFFNTSDSVPSVSFDFSPSLPTSPSFSSTATGNDTSPFRVDVTGNVGTSEDTAGSFDYDEGFTDFPTEDFGNAGVTQRTDGRTTPRRRFGLFGKFKTTPSPATSVTSPTTTADDFEPSVASETTAVPRVPIQELPPGGASLKSAMQNIYLGCESSKGCFGFPQGCENSENCDMLMTYSKVPSGYHFEIMGSTGSSSGYVAGALSSDTKMGTDSVMACVSLNGKVDVLMAFNEGRSNEILTNSKYGLRDIQTAQVDGQVYCSFIRQTVTEIKNIEFNLAADRFHLMLARGPASENQLRFHDKKTFSTSTASLDAFEALEGGSANQLFVTLHACFMIGAWVGAASCGILLARYYKKTWLQYKSCGIDQWFHLHRFFMGLTWSLTVAGFVLIAYYLQGWTDIPPSSNPHAIIGIVSVGLCFIQPFMALCRCSPTHKNRAIFNWFHWFVGNSAQILGLTAIFFGLQLYGLPTWTWFILIVFIAFHCVVHLILSIGQCVSDSKVNSSNNVFPMKEMNGSRNPLHPVDKVTDAPGATFRKAMLTIYLIINWLITALLIFIVVVGEDQLRKWNLLFWEH